MPSPTPLRRSREPFRGRFARGAAALAAALSASSCIFVKSAGSHDWNLSQLHYPSGAYHYTADLVDDFEFVMRSETSGMPLKSSVQKPLGSDKQPVTNPAAVTLENLIDLAKFEPDDERIAGIQVMWFARLAVQDPSKLARERCVLELASLGKRVSIAVPVPLPPEARPIGPDELGNLLADVIREYRESLEERPPSPEQAAEFAGTCSAIGATTFDLEGGRRILFAVNSLVRGTRRGSPEREALDHLSRAAQKVCIEQALATALGDESPLVRAAAVRSSVEAVGVEVIAPVLRQLRNEPSLEVQVAVMDIVAERGLPEAPPGMDPEVYREVREDWILVLYDRAVNQPDGYLQLQAMHALRAVAPPGIESLREEDWERWWYAREAEMAAQEQALEAGAGAPEGGAPEDPP